MSSELHSLINWGFIPIPKSENWKNLEKCLKAYLNFYERKQKKVKFPGGQCNGKPGRASTALFSFETNDQSLLYLARHGEIRTGRKGLCVQ